AVIACCRGQVAQGAARSVALVAFAAGSEPVEVWRSGDVVVSAIAVHHEPVLPAVAYRIDGPSGSVVVSGDTRVCPEVERLAAGVDVLVHEVCLRAFAQAMADTHYGTIAEYHADAVALGASAERGGVKTLDINH